MASIARKHPICNWLRLPASETRRALDKVLDFRDKSADPMASGLPESAVEWFYSEELPRLCMRPDVRLQVEAQIQELMQQAAALEAEISPAAAALQQRLDAICEQVDILEAAMGHD